jgi:hypothetical protein
MARSLQIAAVNASDIQYITACRSQISYQAYGVRLDFPATSNNAEQVKE